MIGKHLKDYKKAYKRNRHENRRWCVKKNSDWKKRWMPFIKYDHDFDKFGNSKVINDCFDDFQFKNTDEFIAIKASGKFSCMYDNNKININITTDKYVSSNNASKVVNNTYSWEINNFNKDNVNIEYMMYKNYPSKNEVVSKEGSLLKNIFYTILLFVIFIGSAFGINIVLKKIDII